MDIRNGDYEEINIYNFCNYGNIDSFGTTGGCIGATNKQNMSGIIKIVNTKNLCNEIKSEKDVAGGIVGYANTNMKLIINKSYNISNIITNSREAGGIIGDTDAYTYCINVYNTGEISARKQEEHSHFGSSGGIIGSSYLNKAEIKVVNAYNIGKIIADNYACGILGIRNDLINNSYIKNVFNRGVLESKKEKYGILARTPDCVGLKFDEIINSFYINNEEKGSNLETDVGTKKTDTDIKSQEFINELNKYVTENPILEIEGIEKIELLKWKVGEGGYPILDM